MQNSLKSQKIVNYFVVNNVKMFKYLYPRFENIKQSFTLKVLITWITYKKKLCAIPQIRFMRVWSLNVYEIFYSRVN